MKLLKHFILTAIFAFASMDIQATARTTFVVNPTSSNGVSAWEHYDSLVGKYVIQACLFNGTTWGSPFIISDTAVDSYRPKAVTNSTGTIAVVWEADNPLTGNLWLCGAIYSGGSWQLPDVISDNTETLGSQEDYFVQIDDNDIASVTYLSQDITTGAFQLRGVRNPNATTWGTPSNIAP